MVTEGAEDTDPNTLISKAAEAPKKVSRVLPIFIDLIILGI